MTTGDQDFSKNRDYLIKQSEMLQAIINRMANNSLQIKQLGLTLWTALVGFGFTYKNTYLFGLALISFILLGLLDMYYLHLERRFRQNFNLLTEVLCGFDSEKLEHIQRRKGNFISLEPLNTNQEILTYIKTLKSWANFPYLIVLIITLVLFSLN